MPGEVRNFGSLKHSPEDKGRIRKLIGRIIPFRIKRTALGRINRPGRCCSALLGQFPRYLGIIAGVGRVNAALGKTHLVTAFTHISVDDLHAHRRLPRRI